MKAPRMQLDIESTEKISSPEESLPQRDVSQQMESSKAVRNIASALLTQLLSFVLTMAINYFLPRYAGEVGLGKIAYGTLTVGILAVIIPLGTESVLVREIARDKTKTTELLLGAILLRLPLSLIVFALTYGFACFMNYDVELRHIVLAMGLWTIVTSLGSPLGTGVQGQEKIVWLNIVKLIQRFAESILTITLVLLKAPLWAIATTAGASALLASIINLSLFDGLLPQFRKILSNRSTIEKLWQQMRYLVVAGLPFVGWSIANQLYGYTDPFVLKAIAPSAIVGLKWIGWYNVALRLSGTTLFIPVAISGSLTPTLMRLYREDIVKFEQLARRMFSLCLLTGIPASLALSFGGEQLFTLLRYPQGFAGALPVLQVAGGFTLTICMGIALSTILIASDRQKVMLHSAIIGGVIGIPLCIAGSFITQHLYRNAAIGATASDAVLEICLLIIYVRGLPFHLFNSPTLAWMGRCAVASLPMILILLFTKHGQFGGWGLLPAFIVYCVACLLLKCIDKEWMNLIRGVIHRQSEKA